MIEKSVQRQLQVVPFSNCQSFAILLVRIVVGVAFVFHGWGKIQNPFGWMPEGSGVPGVFQFLAALSEFGGGIGLLVGFLTPLWALGLAFTMAVATYMHMIVMKDPFVNMTGGSSYEPALGYFVVSLLLFAIGPGRYSVDAKVFGERR
jgi:putative oxidoreductase